MIISVLSDIMYPATAFAITWIIVTNCFSVCDIFQPEWYKKRCIANLEFYKPMQVAEYFKLLAVNIKNLQLMFVLLFLCALARKCIIGDTSLIPWMFGKNLNWYIRFLIEVVGAAMWGEIWFFLAHEFAHMPQMKHWHAKHHEYSHTCYALVGLYCSWQEILLVNFPLGTGWAILVKMDPMILSIFFIFAAWHIAHDHSAHKLIPNILDDPQRHLKHHSSRNENYGAAWVHALFQANHNMK